MIRCRHCENGKCKVLGTKITVDCKTIRNYTPNLCKEITKNKRDGFSGTSGKIDKRN